MLLFLTLINSILRFINSVKFFFVFFFCYNLFTSARGVGVVKYLVVCVYSKSNTQIFMKCFTWLEPKEAIKIWQQFQAILWI